MLSSATTTDNTRVATRDASFSLLKSRRVSPRLVVANNFATYMDVRSACDSPSASRLDRLLEDSSAETRLTAPPKGLSTDSEGAGAVMTAWTDARQPLVEGSALSTSSSFPSGTSLEVSSSSESIGKDLSETSSRFCLTTENLSTGPLLLPARESLDESLPANSATSSSDDFSRRSRLVSSWSVSKVALAKRVDKAPFEEEAMWSSEASASAGAASCASTPFKSPKTRAAVGAATMRTGRRSASRRGHATLPSESGEDSVVINCCSLVEFWANSTARSGVSRVKSVFSRCSLLEAGASASETQSMTDSKVELKDGAEDSA